MKRLFLCLMVILLAAQFAVAADVNVPPGLTGLWQVSGRNETTFARRVALDSEYIQRWSQWLDIYILMKTLKVVLWRDGAY